MSGSDHRRVVADDAGDAARHPVARFDRRDDDVSEPASNGNRPSELPVPGWYGAEPADPDYELDPYPYFRRLRETQPVNLTPDGNWRLTRYDDVVRLLREVPTGMRHKNGLLPGQLEDDSGPGSGVFMLQQDPPVHTRLRKLVSKAFTPRAVESWRGRIEAITHELLDRIEAKGSLELVSDFARPVPATLICELLGVPVEDRDTFADWTTDATHALAVSRRVASPEVEARVQHAAGSLAMYFDRLIAERRGSPGDDLLSVLISAEEDGERLDHVELMSQSIGLLIAGFETTIGLIGNGMVSLMENPAELERLREEPELIESAVEECLRCSGPVTMTVRVTREDTRFGEFVIPEESQVFAVIAGANRDPERFEDPERFDVARYAGDAKAAPHLSFGGGVHHCLGAHLARLETQVAIGALVQRFRDLRLGEGGVEWGRSLFRVPGRVPVEFTSAR